MANSFVGVWQELLRLVQDGQHQDSAAAALTRLKALRLEARLDHLPPQPKSAWKKVVRDIQVPLQLGTAFRRTAAQHCPTFPAVHTALGALNALLRAAEAAGLLTNSGAVGPLGVSMRQQLQQAGVLPQLAGVMAALAADLRAEAAALGSKSSDELCASLTGSPTFRKGALQQLVKLLSLLLTHLKAAWGFSTETSQAQDSSAWLVDASGHAEATMQLCMAALQHASSVLQHVLPAVQQGAPQLAAELQTDQAAVVASVLGLSSGILAALCSSRQHFQPPGPDEGGPSRLVLPDSQAGQRAEAHIRHQLQKLLLSPHCLPFIVSQLVLCSWCVCQWQDSSRLQAVEDGLGSKAQAGGSRGASNSLSATHSARGMSQHTPTPCQLRLLELLGLAPQMAAAVERIRPVGGTGMSVLLDTQLPNTVTAGLICFLAVGAACCTADQQGQGSVSQPARWQLSRFERQLWMLLPPLLLPCANHLLLLAAGNKDAQQQQQQCLQLNASELVHLCKAAMVLLQHLSPADTPAARRPPCPSWMEEVLGGVLQFADQLLPPHPQQPAAAPAAAAGTSRQGSRLAAAVSTNSSSNISSATTQMVCVGSEQQADSAAVVVDLLSLLVAHSLANEVPGVCTGNDSTASPGLVSSSSSSSSRDKERSPGAATTAAGGTLRGPAPTTPQLAVAQWLVEVCAVLEGGLRTATAAVQALQAGDPMNTFSSGLIPESLGMFLGGLDPTAKQPALLLHLGLARPEALPAQLRQLYSLLSTVQKLGRCQPLFSGAPGPGVPCLGQEAAAAGACCCAVGQAAVMLLQPTLLTAGSTAAQTSQALFEAGTTAVVQQPESSFLPSLVIFGRCCLVWADQLQQQAPQLLLTLASGAGAPQQGQQQQQQQQQGGMQAEYSAACVCIPGVQNQRAQAAAEPPPCGLEWTATVVSAWVGIVTTPSVQAALAAAAGGHSFDQFRQQLEALAAAQQAVRQGVTDASLSALVQQLRDTGVILSSIAVPHFCNNAGCVNINGPTEVGLVSGRSCLCSGCRTARYCSRACQLAAWPQHKRVCKALAAAAAAPGAGAEGL